MSSTALHDISFSINRGEIVAVVGESGSGKSVTALSILRLLPSKITRFTSGEIVYSNQGSTGTDILKLSEAAMRELRGNDIAMIFQEPMTSLNPVFTCGDQVREAIQLHRKISKNQAEQTTNVDPHEGGASCKRELVRFRRLGCHVVHCRQLFLLRAVDA